MMPIPQKLSNFLALIDKYTQDVNQFVLADWEQNRDEFNQCYTEIYKRWFPTAKEYSDEHVAGQIFLRQVKTKSLKLYYQIEMYAFLKSVKRIDQQVIDLAKKPDLTALLFCVQMMRELVREGIEYLNYVSVETEKKSRNYGIGKRGVLGSKELFDTAIMLLYEDFNPKRLGGFALAPTSVMVLRQAVEVRLRNAFGIHAIYEQDGRVAKTPQKFFFFFIKAHAESITLPIGLPIIEAIFDWTQTFVHGGILKQTWDIEWAFHILAPLFAGTKNANGGWHYLGSIQIKKELIDNRLIEINKLLGRRIDKLTWWRRLWERVKHKQMDPVILETLNSPDASVIA